LSLGAAAAVALWENGKLVVGGRQVGETQALFGDSLCIETAGLAGKTWHLFTAGESEGK